MWLFLWVLNTRPPKCPISLELGEHPVLWKLHGEIQQSKWAGIHSKMEAASPTLVEGVVGSPKKQPCCCRRCPGAFWGSWLSPGVCGGSHLPPWQRPPRRSIPHPARLPRWGGATLWPGLIGDLKTTAQAPSFTWKIKTAFSCNNDESLLPLS